MRIDQMLKKRRVYSFEFFPPKSAKGEELLRKTLAALAGTAPSFVSITYGAGGSTRERTVELAVDIKRLYGMEAMAHLTCVNHSRDEIREIMTRLRQGGIENLLALRGDPPEGTGPFAPHPAGFATSGELVAEGVRQGFCVGVAGYPEGHPESPDLAADVRWLRGKVDQGASFIITQLFFENHVYFDFVSRVRAAGISVPVIPGVFPVESLDKMEKVVCLCGATVPPGLRRLMENKDEDQARTAGIAWAASQCRDLVEAGVPGIHFFTLNQSAASREIRMFL